MGLIGSTYNIRTVSVALFKLSIAAKMTNFQNVTFRIYVQILEIHLSRFFLLITMILMINSWTNLEDQSIKTKVTDVVESQSCGKSLNCWFLAIFEQFRDITSIHELHSSRDALDVQIKGPQIWCFWNFNFIKMINFNCVLQYDSVELNKFRAIFWKLRQFILE